MCRSWVGGGLVHSWGLRSEETWLGIMLSRTWLTAILLHASRMIVLQLG